MASSDKSSAFLNFPSIGMSISFINFAYQMLLILRDIEFLKLCFRKRILNDEILVDAYMSRNY